MKLLFWKKKTTDGVEVKALPPAESDAILTEAVENEEDDFRLSRGQLKSLRMRTR